EFIGSLKRRTRAGMGRCQGRYCGPVIAALIAERTDTLLDEFSLFAPRPPVKPVPIGAIARPPTVDTTGESPRRRDGIASTPPFAESA
ncbi:MAG: (2Fe-2S)-binding protein, partial [Gammaproteobacteria bacterium]|nr:(2Fe-2S)-binding protein [Gammaproteobacteria bacterium]